MRRRLSALLPLILACAGCNRATVTDTAAVENSVRAFTRVVAQDITQDGPTAWSKHFADTPAFFMAVNGQMAFLSGAAALAAIPNVALAIKHIELQWGDDLRVDVLTPVFAVVGSPYSEIQEDAAGHRAIDKGYFTGLVEYRDGRWKFRDAHWSSAAPATPVP
jgi:hypothetical protein